MFGQMNHGNRRYYRHAHVYRVRNCPLQNPKPWVRADVIEAAVIRQLFELYGNPAAIERAIKAAVPDCEKAIKRRSNIEEELNKLERGRDRVLDHIERDTITQAQADKKLRDMSKREAELRAELERLNDELANVPDAKTIEVYREQFGQLFELYDQYGNRYAGGNDISSFVAMKAADRRKLVDFAFAGMRPDGKPTGVYVTPMPGQAGRQKKYTYQLIGIFGGVKPRALP
jgi:hypothetical protein